MEEIEFAKRGSKNNCSGNGKVTNFKLFKLIFRSSFVKIIQWNNDAVVCQLKINRSIFSLHWHCDTAVAEPSCTSKCSVPDAPGTDATLRRYKGLFINYVIL